MTYSLQSIFLYLILGVGYFNTQSFILDCYLIILLKYLLFIVMVYNLSTFFGRFIIYCKACLYINKKIW